MEGQSTDPRTLHKYAYAANNPLLYTDPSGLFWLIKGNLAHKYIQGRYGVEPYHSDNDYYFEYYLNNVPNRKGYGYLDIIDFTTEEFYEIKKSKQREIKRGRKDINDYLVGLRRNNLGNIK
jgi:hypothetical protein